MSAERETMIQQLRGLPALMRERRQWLMWRFEQYAGDKKPRKVPYYASGRKRGGTQGSAEDREALVPFDQALQRLEAGAFEGIGFAFLPGDGLIGIDIDGMIDPDTGEVEERCRKIIDACASYTEYSPSGKGVHIIVQGETATFKDNSVGLEVFCGRQFFTCTGRRWPGTPDTVESLAESTLRRLQATVKQAKGRQPAQTSAPPQAGHRDTLRAELEDALRFVSPDIHHDEWVLVGQALEGALGPAGQALWEYWSSRGRNPATPKVFEQKWRSFKGAGASGTKATEATIFKMARDAGWRPTKPKRSSKAARAAAAEEQSTPLPGSADEGGSDDEQADTERWRKRLLKTSDGNKRDCRENVFLFLTEHSKLRGLVAFDEFSYRILKLRAPPWASTKGEWTTNDDYELGLWLAETQGARLIIKSESTLAAGVAMAANRAKFHPVRKYLGELSAWDEIPRLAHWLHECCGAADSTYHQLVGRWFILGMVNRVLNPGCQMDYMIVLEGAQGKLKSSALRALAGDWFADTPIRIGDKDAMLNLAGVWLYEVAELDAFNKAEITAVKQYVSSRVDRVREPYSRRPADRSRSCVLAGTTNQHEYFKDPTGSRRMWPVACDGAIDLEKLRAWRDMLFAEALHMLKAGERYHPTLAEAKKYIEPEQESREIADPWFERIAIWVDNPDQELVNSYTTSQILSGALHVPADRIDGARQMATRVGIAMRKLGWLKVRDKTGARLWRYMRPKPAVLPAEEDDGTAGADKATQGFDGGPSSVWSADGWGAGNAG